MLDLGEVRTHPVQRRRKPVSWTASVRVKDGHTPWQSRDVQRLCSIICCVARKRPAVPFQVGAPVNDCGIGLLPDGMLPRGLVRPAVNGAARRCDLNVQTAHRQRLATLHGRLLKLAGG